VWLAERLAVYRHYRVTGEHERVWMTREDVLRLGAGGRTRVGWIGQRTEALLGV
jgi:hypothetical protein